MAEVTSRLLRQCVGLQAWPLPPDGSQLQWRQCTRVVFDGDRCRRHRYVEGAPGGSDGR